MSEYVNLTNGLVHEVSGVMDNDEDNVNLRNIERDTIVVDDPIIGFSASLAGSDMDIIFTLLPYHIKVEFNNRTYIIPGNGQYAVFARAKHKKLTIFFKVHNFIYAAATAIYSADIEVFYIEEDELMFSEYFK